MDGSVFQAQIFMFLWNNAPYKKLEKFVGALCEIVKVLNPALIYLYREDTEKAINYFERDRGAAVLDNMWQRDKSRPYYRDKPEGAEGFRHFLKDYASCAKSLFDAYGYKKLSVEVTNGDWKKYENAMCAFLEINNFPNPDFTPPDGVYTNDCLNDKIVVDGLKMTDPNGRDRLLTPKNETDFYVERLPVILSFEKPGRLIISGTQICERWTTTGTVYKKS